MGKLAAPLQIILNVLSVPLLTAAISWLARRFTKESRLTIRVERLAGIYTDLPEGPAREEFAKRVGELTAELSARIDPLFELELRRKWKVACWTFGVGAVLTVFPGRALFGAGVSSWVGILLGAVCVIAFLAIERDMRKQRAAIAAPEAAVG